MTQVSRGFPDREEDARKGDAGRVLVVGGSAEYPSTPAIAALAAARAGADVVSTLSPDRSAAAVATHAMDIIAGPLDGDRLGLDHIDTVVDRAGRADAMVIGNGLGRDEETLEAGLSVLERTDCPVVVDADMLHADLSPELFEERKALLTPHRGEFEMLYEEPEGPPGALKQKVKHAARTLGAPVLLKGPDDIVSDGERTEWSSAGVPEMARGGTGDLLAGIAGTLLARTDPVRAGHIAAACNGIAGRLAVEDQGDSVLVGHILGRYPDAIHSLREKGSI